MRLLEVCSGLSTFCSETFLMIYAFYLASFSSALPLSGYFLFVPSASGSYGLKEPPKLGLLSIFASLLVTSSYCDLGNRYPRCLRFLGSCIVFKSSVLLLLFICSLSDEVCWITANPKFIRGLCCFEKSGMMWAT